MPTIVYIDDDPEDFLSVLEDGDRANFNDFDPTKDEQRQPAFQAAATADLWVFDYFYSDQRTQAEALENDNGLTTFQKWKRLMKEERPPTALVSSDLEQAIGPGVPTGRDHVLAHRAGVEWVATKSKESAEFLVALASASEKIRKDVEAAAGGKISNEQLCLKLLNAPEKVKWRGSAERQLDRARPPQLSSVAQPQAKARVLLSWLLHSVLPYHSFLINPRQAAAKLGVTNDTMSRLEDDSKTSLARDLKAARYTGPLSANYPTRYWRAAVDDIVWRISQEKKPYADGLKLEAAGIQLDMLTIEDPVVVSNVDLIETDEIASSRACVRVQDEYFPPDVPPAWVKLEVARENADIIDKIVFEDRELLEA